MVKKIKKYLKFAVCCSLIMSLIAPSYAALSASDGSAFVTKAEFDAALADFNSRLTTFEAGINSKIDSQVTSYLDRNGIWNGKAQEFINCFVSEYDGQPCDGWYLYTLGVNGATYPMGVYYSSVSGAASTSPKFTYTGTTAFTLANFAMNQDVKTFTINDAIYLDGAGSPVTYAVADKSGMCVIDFFVFMESHIASCYAKRDDPTDLNWLGSTVGPVYYAVNHHISDWKTYIDSHKHTNPNGDSGYGGFTYFFVPTVSNTATGNYVTASVQFGISESGRFEVGNSVPFWSVGNDYNNLGFYGYSYSGAPVAYATSTSFYFVSKGDPLQFRFSAANNGRSKAYYKLGASSQRESWGLKINTATIY